MPRQAHGRPLISRGSSKPSKKKPATGQYYHALEIAERKIPTDVKVRQNRLGEVESDDETHRNREKFEGRSSKRRRLSRNEDIEDDTVIDGGSDGERWHEGVYDEDSDSEINSDEAFGESDQEKFQDFKFSGSSRDRNGNRNATAGPPRGEGLRDTDINLSEGLDLISDASDALSQSSDDLQEEGVDLATAWDMDEEANLEKDKSRKAKSFKGDRRSAATYGDRTIDSDIEANSEEGDQIGGASTEDDISSEFSFSDDDDQKGLSNLRTFVEGLGSKGDRRDSKQFSSLGDISATPAPQLSKTDLLKFVKDPQQRRSLKILINSDKSAPENYRGGIPGKLEPPLAKRQQDRLDRVAAYDKSKETLNRWIDTVKTNRRAEHISFPLQDPNAIARLSAKELVPTVQSRPLTSLEATIQQIMQESGMSSAAGADFEDEERAFEELQQKNMSLHEIQARRAELRKTRDLMFREEIRSRRIKKIKSKAYRRIHRKGKDKIAQEERAYLSAAGLIDSDQEREKNDRRRAEERMGARHRESKWAKAVKATGRTAWDEEARQGVQDLARRNEELRKRIEGKSVRDPDASEPSSSSESDNDSEVYSNDEFLGFDEKLDLLEEHIVPETTSKLGTMAFMQKAEAARKAANDQEIRRLRDTLRGQIDSESEEFPKSSGRFKFGVDQGKQPTNKAESADKSEFEERISVEGEEELDVPQTTGSPAPQGSAQEVRSLAPSEPLPGSRPRHGRQVHTKLSGGDAPRAKTVSQSIDVFPLHEPDDASDLEGVAEDFIPDLSNNAAIAKALFAGDDVVSREFEKEKKETAEEEDDQVIDNTMPGWGSWTGAGISKREQKRNKGRLLTIVKGIPKDKRKDAKLERVIINEKKVKNNAKYLASELPHPFESRQQYERSLRLPIGPEWTTKTTFQDATKPRVLVKQGIIQPMARPMV